MRRIVIVVNVVVVFTTLAQVMGFILKVIVIERRELVI